MITIRAYFPQIRALFSNFRKKGRERLEDVLKAYGQDKYIDLGQDVFKTSLRRLLKTYELGEYIRLDQDVLKTSSEDEHEKLLQDVFKTSSSRRKFAEVLLLRIQLNLTTAY